MRAETKAELKERADRASREATLYQWIAVDLALKRKPDASETVDLGEEIRRLDLYRATGAAGGLLVTTITISSGQQWVDLAYFEEAASAAYDHATRLGGDLAHRVAGAMARLNSARMQLFEDKAQVAP